MQIHNNIYKKSLINERQKGFTLLEIILVLALIGVIASVILPNLHMTLESQMSLSIRNLSGQIRAAYDNALFSGRMQRMVFDTYKGEYWVEQAPINFYGRPPLIDEKPDPIKESNRKTYLETLQEKAKNFSNRQSPYSTSENPLYYSIRSIPVVHRKILEPIQWYEVNDNLIEKQTLIGNVIIAKFISGLTSTAYEYHFNNDTSEDKNKKLCYIYFLPDGTTSLTSIQLGIQNQNHTVSENDAKYTLNLNTLTGQIKLLEGFQDANFNLPKK